jgi:hypothetical protein
VVRCAIRIREGAVPVHLWFDVSSLFLVTHPSLT